MRKERAARYVRVSIRWMYGSALGVILAAMATFGTAAYSFVQLETNENGFYWASGGFSPIYFVIQEAGSDDIPDRSEEAAIRLAFQTWQEVETSGITFQEDRNPAARARTDWQSDDIHLCMFIEDDSVSYFNNNSGLIAVTPIDFLADGTITDADILFNGRDHRFSTDGKAGTYDVQNIATHEVGHFIGLDHSGVYGSTMVPISYQQEVRLRSLSQDDRAGASTLYPTGATASIRGRVRRADGSGVVNAYVTAVDSDGIVASGDLTDPNGYYEIRGLPGNDLYRVYVEPLDGPLRKENLYARTPDLDFGTTWLGGNTYPTTVNVGLGTVQVEDIVVRPATPKNVVSTNRPIVQAGANGVSIFFSGTQLRSDDTVEVTGRDVEVVSVFGLASGASVTVNVRPGAKPGCRSVSFTDADGNTTILTGGLEIGLPAPTVTICDPVEGPTTGGTLVTLTGTGFRDGAHVVAGEDVATDVQVLSETRLTFRTPPQGPGTKDLVVINPDGQEARLRSAFTFTGSPPPPPQDSGGSSTTAGNGNQNTGVGAGIPGFGQQGGGIPFAPSSGGGGGGCSLHPRGPAAPHAPLLLLASVLLLLALRRRNGTVGIR